MLCYIDLVGRNAIADQDSVRLSIPTVSDQFLRLLTSGGPTHLSPTAPSTCLRHTPLTAIRYASVAVQVQAALMSTARDTPGRIEISDRIHYET